MTNEEKLYQIFPDGICPFSKVWLSEEYREPTTKNNLGVDCISRKAALDITWHDPSYSDPLNVLTEVRDKIRELPSVTPQEPIIDKIRAEILEEKEHAYADFERYKVEYLGQDWEDALDSLPQDDFRYGMERAIELIDKYKAESEVDNGNDD